MVIFVTILQLICALLLVAVVLFQSGKSKARSLDARLAKSTKWIGAVFVVLTLVLNCMLAAGL